VSGMEFNSIHVDALNVQWLLPADDDGGSTEFDAAFRWGDLTDLSLWPDPEPEQPSLQLGLSGPQGAHSPAVYGAAGPSSRSLLVDEEFNAYAVDLQDLRLFEPLTLGVHWTGYAPMDGVPDTSLGDSPYSPYQGEDGVFDPALSDGLQAPASDFDWIGGLPAASTPDVSMFAVASPRASHVLDE